MMPPVTLTGHLRDKNSPVYEFLRSRFPNTDRLLKEPRKLVRETHRDNRAILPATRLGYPLNHIGMAIDYRIRYYFEVGKTKGHVHLPLDDLEEFFENLTSLTDRLAPPRKRLEHRDEDEINRYCIALAYLDALARGFATKDTIGCTSVMELLERPESFWLDDMRSMSWTFYDECSHLLTRPFKMNPSFAGLACDADLIVDGALFEIKASTKLIIDPNWLRQIMGYVLLDTSDAYSINSIGLYLARQGLCLRWYLEKALSELCGNPSPSIETLRMQFRSMLDCDLPEYWAECMARHYEES